MSTERWLSVVDYEGLYEVSDEGRVRSVDRVVPHPNGALRLRGRVLTPAPFNERGHLGVALCRDGKPRPQPVHKLVLLAFVGPRPEGMQGCHADDDPTNNSLVNLRWDTPKANMLDAVRNGRVARHELCSRGHRLIARNLQPAALARGVRVCRACRNARYVVNYAAQRGRLLDLCVVADRKYAEIMEVAT